MFDALREGEACAEVGVSAAVHNLNRELFVTLQRLVGKILRELEEFWVTDL